MTLILIAALCLFGTAATLVVRSISMPRARMSQTLGRIDAYRFASVDVVELEPRRPLRDVVDKLASAIGARVGERFSSLRTGEIRTVLMGAGLYKTPPLRFLGYRVLAAIGMPFVWLWLAPKVGVPSTVATLTIPGAAYVGWWLPFRLVRIRAERRFEKIDRELPELIDLLVVTVEAGVGFSASLQQAALRLQGPLSDEIKLMLQEQRMGLSTNEALQNMLARADTPSVRSFVRSILQGETLGVSIGQIMRGLAVEMRRRRKAAAEQKAQKAPIKILFPLVFLIFPAMYVIILGPTIPTVWETFGSGGGP